MTNDQIKALKPGDPVAYQHRGRTYVTKVQRVLQTQIVTQDERRWTRKNGGEHGTPSGYGHERRYLLEATRERIAAAAEADEHEKLARRLGGIDWTTHGLAALRRVIAIVEETTP